MRDTNQSGINLNDDLEKKGIWVSQWKMSLNPYINKQAEEVMFSCELQKLNHLSLTFNVTTVTQSVIQK